MADIKISALTAISAVAAEDLLAVVDDPSGAASTKKATIAQLLAGSGCRVELTGTQSIPNSAHTAVSFTSEAGSEDFDDDGYHDPATNPSRFTVPTDGLYIMSGAVEYAANSTGRRFAIPRINGTTDLSSSGMQAMSSGGTFIGMPATIMRMSAGDYAELVCFHTAGASLDVQSSSAVTYFAIARLGF